MSLDALKYELRALNADQQRQLAAFLVSLEDARVDDFRKKHAKKVDRPERPASDYATLEEMDRRLGFSSD